MSQKPHFFIPNSSLSENLVIEESLLPSDVQNHLRALRLREGDELKILNGKGLVADGIYSQKKIQLKKLTAHLPLAPNIHLVLSPPRGDALWEAITQSTEIGASHLSLIRSDHCQFGKNQAPSFDRAQRISDAAMEQCCRPWRMELSTQWSSLETMLQKKNVLHVVADEGLAGNDEIGFFNGAPQIDATTPIFLYIGPEGGWSDRERQLFDNVALKLGLGSLVLRVPTACVASIHFLRIVYTANKRL